MLNSGKEISRDKKKKIVTLILSEQKILNEKKPISPPLQVKWSVPNVTDKNNIAPVSF